MEWWQALVLGLVEGLTEYLPVSSTGHLILAQRAMGIEAGAASNAYAICIQAGAIVAVLGLYRARVVQMLRGLVGLDARGLRLALAIAAAFLPAAVAGLLFDDAIERRLFGLWPVVAAWFVGGLAILVVARARRARNGERARERDGARGRELDELALAGAFAIGLAQCLALWPGSSRSLVTIVGGLLVGLRLSAAVEFSFLLGVATLLAATAYKGVREGGVMLEAYSVGTLALGALAAWLSAVLAVRWMVQWLAAHGLELFGWYRVLLALVVAACLLMC
jgi:undecaprenyl-diphosphatase